MEIFEELYSGKTDWRFSILKRLDFFPNMIQWVATPENGDYLLRMASNDKEAYENPIHQFNMFQLLDSEPP